MASCSGLREFSQFAGRISEQFPNEDGERGFKDVRLHSFRHYFCSTCANNLVPERMVMDWLGHADSDMIRHYYHLHDEEAKRRMNQLDFLGNAGGRFADKPEGNTNEEDAEPHSESEVSSEATAD
ncbi:MAG: site-specific integrase [bacterium]|nr:site-specific integrase [bacterium]